MYKVLISEDSSYIQRYYEKQSKKSTNIISVDTRTVDIEAILRISALENNFTASTPSKSANEASSLCKVIHNAHLLSSADRQLIASQAINSGTHMSRVFVNVSLGQKIVMVMPFLNADDLLLHIQENNSDKKHFIKVCDLISLV